MMNKVHSSQFRLFYLFLIILISFGITSCSDDDDREIVELPGNDTEDTPLTNEEQRNYYINTFAATSLSEYYLWIDEAQVAEKMEEWKIFDDPFTAVKELRYKDSNGKDIDRWTVMLDNFEESVNSFDGIETTYGFDFALYRYDKNNVCAVVTYIIKGSPAENAGWKRGDVIIKVNNKYMPLENDQYYAIVTDELMGGSTLSVEMVDGKQYTINSVTLQEDAVLLTKMFDCQDKTVGYMVYNSFTFDSIHRLIEECKKFKDTGVKELILDLRYNGGGYGITSEALASMLVPEAEVKAESVFQTEVYNKDLTEYYKILNHSNEKKFKTEFKYKLEDEDKIWNTADANIGIEKLYVIITGYSASASEALICGLKPYMPVMLIGQKSYGKYCGGFLLGAQEFYDEYKDPLTKMGIYEAGRKAVYDIGMYVMVSRYADKDGITGCMPDGYIPDIEVEDNPIDGCQLGDPEESMLKVALTQAGYQYQDKPSTRSARSARKDDSILLLDATKQVYKKNFGILVNNFNSETHYLNIYQ